MADYDLVDANDYKDDFKGNAPIQEQIDVYEMYYHSKIFDISLTVPTISPYLKSY